VFNKFYSRHKELLLKVSSIFLVVLFFVAIEVLVRIIFPVRAMDHMIDLGPINLFSKQVINGETWYGITNKNAYSDRNILFREKKGKDQIRIICLGGSASAGWPHPPEEIYSRYLEKTLQKVYPEKKIEIINCSAHGFASYRIRQVFETVIPFDPDAVIVWSGNNEFLEGRNYRTSELKNTLIRFRNNFRSLQLVRQLFVTHRYDDTPDVAETFWKKVKEEALELRTDPEQFEKVKEHYQKSLNGIVEQARKNNIRLLLMTVPVNLRDWEPNVSYLGVSQADSLRWLAKFKQGKKNYLSSNSIEAINAFQVAHKIAPVHAETMFWIARAFEMTNDTIAALEYYIKAKDFDYNPFRAISDFNNTIRNLAANNPEVALMDMEKLMNGYAKKGIPGFDLFLDYVHPTREGNLIIAREVANHILKTNLLSIEPVSHALTLDEIKEINRSEYRDEDDLFLQFTRFSLCCMTHQYYSALHFANFLKENIPAEFRKNDRSGRIDLLNDAINAFQPYVDIEQKRIAQEPTVEEEQVVMKRIRDFYTKHFPYGAF
jgi:tetratricopeptide (TPR) repeat protein